MKAPGLMPEVCDKSKNNVRPIPCDSSQSGLCVLVVCLVMTFATAELRIPTSFILLGSRYRVKLTSKSDPGAADVQRAQNTLRKLP